MCVCVFLCAHKLYILSTFVLIFTQRLGASEILQSSKDCLLFSHEHKDPNKNGTKKCWEDNSSKTYHETHDYMFILQTRQLQNDGTFFLTHSVYYNNGWIYKAIFAQGDRAHTIKYSIQEFFYLLGTHSPGLSVRNAD